MLSLEDETGAANVVIAADVFECDRIVLSRNHFLGIEGPLQNHDSVIRVKAQRIAPLKITHFESHSHDFH
jgi:error-prone DNA polymerase